MRIIHVMALNLFNVQLQESDDEEEKCMICHENISSAQTYSLPECKHIFHTHCIVTWFRHRPRHRGIGTSVDGKCPYCGNCGINHIEEPQQETYCRWGGLYNYEKENLKFIKKYSKTENVPKQLTNLLKKLEIQEQSLKDYKKEKKDLKKSLKTELVNYNETTSKLKSMQRAEWRKKISVRKTQRAISHFPVIPIIIPLPVDINY